MRLEAGDAALLWDMLDAATKILAFVRGKTFQDYRGDELLRAAVERKIEIIGEAASKVSEQLKQDTPNMPWRPIVAQRNVLAHEYGEVNQESIWRVATVRVPELVAALEPLMPQPPDSGE